MWDVDPNVKQMMIALVRSPVWETNVQILVPMDYVDIELYVKFEIIVPCADVLHISLEIHLSSVTKFQVSHFLNAYS